MSIYAREFAQLGQRYLEDAVLEILLEARKSGNDSVGATEIAKQAGIYKKSFAPAYGNAITSGILARLAEQGRIEQSRRRGPWRLTDQEFSKLSKSHFGFRRNKAELDT